MPLSFLIIISLCIITVISGILAIESKDLMHAVFFMGVLLVTLGEIYLLLGAEYIGVVQILVYAGGVTVLMLFTLLFIPKTKERLEMPYIRLPGFVAAVLLLISILLSIGYVSEKTVGSIITPSVLAEYLFTNMLDLVGIVSIVIFIVIVASAYISSVRKR